MPTARRDIRPAHPNDAPGIGAIWNPILRNSVATFEAREKTPEEISAKIAELQREGFGFWVAHQGKNILGFAYYARFRANYGYRFTMEHTIHIAQESAGHGIGRSLMGVLEDDAREKGYDSLIGGISGENKAGRDFHKALGYTEIAHLDRVGYKFDRWFDLILMRKFL